MTPLLKQYGGALLWIICAIAILASALLGKDTRYENAWLYVLAAFFVLQGLWEMYANRRGKGQ